MLCPCVVCFKFLQPKVIEGKKIDCALADPHLPRLLGGAPQLFTTNLVAPSPPVPERCPCLEALWPVELRRPFKLPRTDRLEDEGGRK